MALLILLLALCSILSSATAILPKNARGVNTLYNVTATMLPCLYSSDYSILSANLAHCTNGATNMAGITSIGNWIQAGFTKPVTSRPVGLYGYFTPCFCCPKPPESYIKPMFDAIATKIVNGLQYFVMTYLFIDVETCPRTCGSDKVTPDDMVSMINAVISTAESLRTQYKIPIYSVLGIKTNKNDWETLVGNSDAFSRYDLWYADGEMLLQPRANCSDWSKKSFGGWSQPLFKQYVKGVTTCSNLFDLTVCCNCPG